MEQETKIAWKKLSEVCILGLILLLPFVQAIDLEKEITEEEKETFDEMLTPVMKVYNLIKYTATAIAAFALIFAAIGYMTSSSDPKKRDGAKNTAGYVVMGLFLIWMTPHIIGFLT